MDVTWGQSGLFTCLELVIWRPLIPSSPQQGREEAHPGKAVLRAPAWVGDGAAGLCRDASHGQSRGALRVLCGTDVCNAAASSQGSSSKQGTNHIAGSYPRVAESSMLNQGRDPNPFG